MTEGHQWRVAAAGQRARCEWNQVREQNIWQRLHICGSQLQEAEGQTQVFIFFLLMVILQVVYKAR